MLALASSVAALPPVVSAQAGPPPDTATPTPVGQDASRRSTSSLAPRCRPKPAQADLGSQVYWLHCMVCHGDRGQGLTDEYRAAWPKVDQNCWQAKCHGDLRNPESFVFPKYVPPLIGPGALSHFQNAADLYGFIRANMPYQAPGSLQDQQYWELTAFLARANGAQLAGQTLDGRVGGVGRAPSGPAAGGAARWRVLAGLAFVLIVLGIAIRRRFAGRRT